MNSKKNCVTIGYKPKSKKISFYTWNEGYTFCDTEDNSNIVDIKFKINNEERTKFYYILQDLIDNQDWEYDEEDDDDEDDDDEEDDDEEDDDDEDDEDDDDEDDEDINVNNDKDVNDDKDVNE